MFIMKLKRLKKDVKTVFTTATPGGNIGLLQEGVDFFFFLSLSHPN